MSGPRAVRAPRGNTLTTKGWLQEAALRMLNPWSKGLLTSIGQTEAQLPQPVHLVSSM